MCRDGGSQTETGEIPERGPGPPTDGDGHRRPDDTGRNTCVVELDAAEGDEVTPEDGPRVGPPVDTNTYRGVEVAEVDALLSPVHVVVGDTVATHDDGTIGPPDRDPDSL